MAKLISCRISKKDLKVLYDKLCVDKNTDDINCDKCILRNIEWTACIAEHRMTDTKKNYSKEIVRDLCFAIWHDKILTKNPKHIHH